jgi:hypothetical protein
MSTLHREITIPGFDRLVNGQQIQAVPLGQDEYEVTIKVKGEAMAMMLEVIRLLSLTTTRIYKEVGRAAIAERSDELVSHLREDEQAVALFYWQLRDKGYKHRKAVQITHGDCATVKQRRFTKADIWHFVKCYPRDYYLTSLPKDQIDVSVDAKQSEGRNELEVLHV